MWMKFPVNVNGISVEQQPFKPEHTNDEGGKFCRFPDHFVPKVLALNMGFTVVSQPDSAPEDLPPTSATNAITDMAVERERLLQEIGHVESANKTLASENIALKGRVEVLEAALAKANAPAEKK